MKRSIIQFFKTFAGALTLLVILAQGSRAFGQTEVNFCLGWEFTETTLSQPTEPMSVRAGDTSLSWNSVSLPHTVRIEPVYGTERQWQGYAVYRRFFRVPAEAKGKRVSVRFEAAMQNADVFLNGIYLRSHHGGYLPFSVDLTGRLKMNEENCILVMLSNLDDPQTPPGKPLADLDFNYYSGLYRNAYLIIQDQLHITDAVEADSEAGGGIFTWSEEVSDSSALVCVKTEVRNDDRKTVAGRLVAELYDGFGKLVAEAAGEERYILPGVPETFQFKLRVNDPVLWSPDNPNLYRVKVILLSGKQVHEIQNITIGIRTFSFDPQKGFRLNGKSCLIRGTNRHQEYPWIGNALSDNAQYRDAWKIKQAGFNFVRCSHYPQSPAFLDACDRLGILVMNSTPGWQFFGDSIFRERCLSDIRGMIHRDRNHPCVILWEASLNESAMSTDFMIRAHETVHRELPVNDVYTCGWMDTVYDVFIPARQHAKPPYYWNRYTGNRPLLIAEYGDWEYYAQNAGFNQKSFSDLKEEERTSRQLRRHGPRRLLQQALNYQEAHNDNLRGKAAGDANWLMFDYKRGYAPDIEASGIMDIFRLPKYSFYFFQSQQEPTGNTLFNKPMVFIANEWNDPLHTEVKIFSNCSEVDLYLNNKLIGRQKADSDTFSTNLPYPPFTFHLDKFVPGTIRAVGYRGAGNNNINVAECSRTTPETPVALSLEADISGRELESGCNDVIFLYARVCDARGKLVQNSPVDISFFVVEGKGELIGNIPATSETGIATILLKAGDKPGIIEVKAVAEGLQPATLRIKVK